MTPKLNAMLEAERRGILPPDKAVVLGEARKRGLIPGAQPQLSEMDKWAEQEIEQPHYFKGPSLARGIPIVGGFLDEAAAGVNAGLSYAGKNISAAATSAEGTTFNEEYERELAIQRAIERKSRTENPVGDTAARVAGGLAAGGAIPAAKTVLGNVALGSGVGGAIFSGHAAGDANPNEETLSSNIEERAKAAQNALLPGMTLGALIPAGIAGATSAYRGARNFVAPRVQQARGNVEQAADEFMAQQFSRSGKTPLETVRDLRGADRSARLDSNSTVRLNETIADTSDDMQRLAGTIYRQGGEGGQRVQRFLDQRQKGPDNPFETPPEGTMQGQAADVQEALERALLIKTQGSAHRTEQQLMNAQRAQGSELYKEAYKSTEAFDIVPALTSLGQRMQNYPTPFAARLKRAYNLFLRGPTGKRTPVNNIQNFDASKKSLDDMIEQAQRTGQGNLGRELTQFKNELLDNVHAPNAKGAPTINTKYFEARNAWGSAAENREAINLGRQSIREDSEVTAEVFRSLSPGQQQLFRIGLRAAVQRAMSTRTPGNDATRLFTQPRVRDLLRVAVPVSKKRSNVFKDRAARLGDIMTRLERQGQTRNRVTGGSPTQQRQMDDARAAVDMLGSAMQGLRGGVNVVLEAVTVSLQRALGYSTQVSAEIARRLVTTNRAEQLRLLRKIQQRMGRQRMRPFFYELQQAIVASQGGVGAR